MSSLPKKVRFLYRADKATAGSTSLRAQQLCNLAKAHLGDRYDFATMEIPRLRFPWDRWLWIEAREEAVYILVKNAIAHFSRSELAMLKRKSLGICADYIDLTIKDWRQDSIDVHIASSYGQEQALTERLAAGGGTPSGSTVAVLLHNTDGRLEGLSLQPPDRFSPIYFGDVRNAALTPYTRSQISILSIETDEDMSRSFSVLAGHNAHFAARPSRPGKMPPFTKGFTAAVCQSNILVNRSVNDAAHFLGEDYPYLIDDPEPATVDEGFRRMADSYGSSEWRRGLEVMADIRERVSPPKLASDLDKILRQVLG